MTRGRKPLPSATKRLRGNPGKRKLNHAEPQFEAGIPDAPPILEGDALIEWHRVTEELAAKQIITGMDMAIVMLYCQTYADWTRHRQILKNEADFLTTDKNYSYPNPRIGLINTLGDRLKSYASELGITPASRQKVKMIGKPPVAISKPSLADTLFNSLRKSKK